MNIPSKPGKKFAPRSRSGCLDCRSHHRKCDEKHPVCGLCQDLGRSCQYGLRVRWSGSGSTRNESFTSPSVIQIQSTQHDAQGGIEKANASVHGVAATIRQRSTSPISGSTQSQNLPLVQEPVGHGHDRGLLRIRAPSLFPELSLECCSLLDYFFRAADTLSCSYELKQDFCATLIPIATENTHVMASILSFSAVQRSHSGFPQSTAQLAALQLAAVNQLRLNMLTASTEATVAAVLMLCYSSIIAGSGKEYSWRFHLEGAALLFKRNISLWHICSSNSTRSFLSRCFVSLAALASISVYPLTNVVSDQAMHMIANRSSSRCINEFTAYSVDLVYALFEIGSLIQVQKARLSIPHHDCFPFLEDRSSTLIQEIEATLHANNSAKLCSPAFARMSSIQQQEYMAIDECYHQAAILQIYRRVHELPSAIHKVQKVVRRILNLVSIIKFRDGPCPIIVLFFPVFSAGCSAITPVDQQQVRTILHKLVDSMGFCYIREGIRILEALWATKEEGLTIERGNYLDSFIGRDTDLILY
ncbi:fungal-specific transcription factor domain-containing protein [Xylaria arbuscula]|nr:fungal-specific transcription factor domain-containing protein [Xylaria arbuscula]